VSTVVFEQVGSFFGAAQIVNAHDFEAIKSRAKQNATNSTKSVNTDTKTTHSATPLVKISTEKVF